MKQRRDWGRGQSLRARRIIIVLFVIEIAALANIVACASTLAGHNTDLGLLTGVAGLALTLAVFGVSRATTGATRRTDSQADGRPAHPSTKEQGRKRDFPH
jgi:hypothetical protein